MLKTSEEWEKELDSFVIKCCKMSNEESCNGVVIAGAIVLLAKTIMRFEYPQEIVAEQQTQLSLEGQIIAPAVEPATCASCGTYVFVEMGLKMSGAKIVCPECKNNDWV